jgi:H+/Cl- antiporter ClcA
MTKELTLSGMGGAFGGLFSSPLMATILVLEIAQPPRNRYGNSFYGTVVASATSLGIYFAIAGSVFLGLYEVPQYDYEDWHLLAGVGLGLFAAFVVIVTLAVAAMTKRLLGIVKIPTVPLAVIGGLLFGLVGVMLPLTNFTGSDQLTTILSEASTLGTGLLIATLVGKMFTFAVSSATGFIGGPIFVMLFIGGTAGIIVNLIIPDIPLALAFTCMLAAVPGSIVSAPFSLVLLAALLTQVGTIQTSPIVIAVATSFLTISALKFAVSRRRTAPGANSST